VAPRKRVDEAMP